jgi:hypothetical protein
MSRLPRPASGRSTTDFFRPPADVRFEPTEHGHGGRWVPGAPPHVTRTTTEKPAWIQ